VVDVVPFVALAPTPVRVSVDAARAFADWIGRELAVPSFLYDLADPRHRTLPAVRRDAFTRRASDFGPAAPHPRLGTSAVGARTALVAINVELDDANVDLARAVARQVRERDGGLAGVRALGLALPSLGRAQVSMNLVDLDSTGIEAACIAVRERVEALGGRVRRVELVGLVPAAALEPVSRAFLVWSGLSSTETVEARAGAGTAVPDASDAGPGLPA
jgi:glutamate formiminotransferase